MPHAMTDDAHLRDWPFLPSRALRIVRGEGAWLIADDGRRILDAAGGAIVTNVGHGRAEVAEAIAKAGAAGLCRPRGARRSARRWSSGCGATGCRGPAPHPPHQRRLGRRRGGGEDRPAALRRQGRGAPLKIMARELSYHGTTIAMAGLSGHQARKRGLEGFLQTFPARRRPRRCAARWAAPPGRRRLLCRRARARRSRPRGRRPSPPWWSSRSPAPAAGPSCRRRLLAGRPRALRRVRHPADRRRGDDRLRPHRREVRRRPLGREPDILVSGKGLAGGYAAICGVFATRAVAEPIGAAGLDVMFHTFAALPSACAAADAVLDILTREQLVERAATHGARLSAQLHARLGQHPHVAEVRGLGLLQAVEIVRDRDTLEPFEPRSGSPTASSARASSTASSSIRAAPASCATSSAWARRSSPPKPRST